MKEKTPDDEFGAEQDQEVDEVDRITEDSPAQQPLASSPSRTSRPNVV